MNQNLTDIRSLTGEDAIGKGFRAIWPEIVHILEAFSGATTLPIFIYLNDKLVFSSSIDSMPPLCQAMLADAEMSERCIADGVRRLEMHEPEIAPGVQLCHAGMANGHKEFATGVGTLTILFGSRMAMDQTSVARRDALIQLVRETRPQLANDLHRAQRAESHTEHAEAFERPDTQLMDSITRVLELLLTTTVGFRSRTISMAHELTLVLSGLGVMAQETSDILNEFLRDKASQEDIAELFKLQLYIASETKLGLYVARNFLSQGSEAHYQQVLRPQFETVDLNKLLIEMLDLYRWRAEQKGISFDIEEFEILPSIKGDEMELKRAFHNVFSNAIKYSYHSVRNAYRSIKIKSQDPFDPGFKNPRFAILFENYGLGLEPDEVKNALKPGFRGQQAINEVPIGSGIGLSEVRKIMQLHKGEIRFQSKEAHGTGSEATYLTTVKLIFPSARKTD